jgi:hypothetical protein
VMLSEKKPYLRFLQRFCRGATMIFCKAVFFPHFNTVIQLYILWAWTEHAHIYHANKTICCLFTYSFVITKYFTCFT